MCVPNRCCTQPDFPSFHAHLDLPILKSVAIPLDKNTRSVLYLF